MDDLLHDIRYALRTFLRTPGFTAVAVAALALGIGANTAIFTIVNAVLIERLPFADPDRLVVIWEETARRPGRPNVVGPANFLRWRERSTAFERMAASYDFRINLTGSGAPEELVAAAVTPEFFPTLGVSPFAGRAFAAGEGVERTEGRDVVTVLSYELWQRRFGGDRGLVGRTIRLGDNPVTVAGIMPPEARLLLRRGSLVSKPPDLWLPFAFVDVHRQPRGRYMTAIARLKPDVTLTEARAQMDTIAAGLTKEWPQFDTGWTVRLVPLHEELSGELRPALLVLSGAVLFVLLIACANVANLLLARGAARAREIAIRTALGARRTRLIRQLLTESLLLALLGGAAGLLLALWSLDLLLALSLVDLPSMDHVRLSSPVLAFTALASIATAVICGLAPAFEGSRADVQGGLNDGARQAGTGVRSRRLRHAFVVSQVALAVVLLAGAGLMLRSLANLRGTRPGFDTHNVLTARVALPGLRYPEPDQRIRFFQEAIARVAALPGVRAAGAVSFLPLTGLAAGTSFTIVGQPPPAPGQEPVLDVRVCDTGYFRTMNIPLLRGRLFTDREMRERSNVVVINETMARQHWPGEDPLGKQVVIRMTDPIVPTEIVGVVGDIRHVDLATTPRAMSYWPHPQLTYSAMTLAVRTASDPLAMASLVEREVQAIDKDQPLSDVRTMDQWVARSLAGARFSSTLLTLFAGLALLLAAVGIYGVMSYSVSQRKAEIGVRMALGAAERDIVTMVVGDGIRLAVVGVAIGVPLALLLARTLSTLLFGTSGADPATFAGVALLVAMVAILASYLPARRSSRIAPVEALRFQ